MAEGEDSTADSHSGTSPTARGGMIPGTARQPAFSLTGAALSPIPVLISVPHAGRLYPRYLLDRMRNPEFSAIRLEDRFADQLGTAVASATGAALLVAHAPRAMIDLNRAADDIDWDMFGRSAPADPGSYAPNRRARSGLGLIPRRLPGLGELWKRRHDETELTQRIADIHQPYHACIEQTLAQIRQRWGAALLLDLHSMPPLAPSAGRRGAEFVLGDRFGAACHGRIVARAFSHFSEGGRLVAHNRPYAGGFVLDRHAAPARGVHALQLEVDRSCYLDSRLAEPGEGFDETVDVLIGLVRKLGAEVALLGSGDATASWVEAAE